MKFHFFVNYSIFIILSALGIFHQVFALHTVDSIPKLSSSSLVSDSLFRIRLPEYLYSFPSVAKPLISKDGKYLYFDVKYSTENIGKELDPDDIWYSELQRDGSWGIPNNFGSNVNSPNSNVLLSLSPNRNTALLAGTFNGSFSLALASLIENQITNITPITITNFAFNRVGRFDAMLAADDSTLILALDTSGKKDLDMYVAFRQGNSTTFSEIISLGKSINTSKAESSPWLAPDLRTLYFSSERTNGFGKSDIYMSKRSGEAWNSWTVPVNLGKTINTEYEDSGISLSASGDTLVYVSADIETGTKGIYFAYIPHEFKFDITSTQKLITEKSNTQAKNFAFQDTLSFTFYFESNSSSLSEIELERLKKICDSVAIFTRSSNITYHVHIESFTDCQGTRSQNQKLALRRAQSIEKILQSRQIHHIFGQSTKDLFVFDEPCNDKNTSASSLQEFRKTVITFVKESSKK